MLRAVRNYRRVAGLANSSYKQLPDHKTKQLCQVRELKDKLCGACRGEEHPRKKFLARRRIQSILDRPNLLKLLRHELWWKNHLLDDIFKRFPSVIATLITIEWEDWANFDRDFLRHVDDERKLLRSDERLPFQKEALSFLSYSYREAFLAHQHTYSPAVLMEGQHQQLSDRTVLPFTERKHIGRGSYGSVYHVKIDDYQYIRLKDQANPTRTKTQLAFKDIRDANSFKRERDIQDSLKRSGAHESILLSSGSFEREQKQEHGIFYPLADLSLKDFFRGNPSLLKGVSQLVPEHVFKQLALIAGSFEFMHENSLHDHAGDRFYHHDFKPENVLVFWHWDESDSVVGTWKIIDFGLGNYSQCRLRELPQQLGISTDISDASSKVDAPRSAGRYQGPQMHIGKKVSASEDRYSFGAVFVEGFAWVLGGPPMLGSLDQARGTGGDDCFWSYDKDDKPILKPTVDEWLLRVKADYGPRQLWVFGALDLIRRLIDIQAADPIKSNEMRKMAEAVTESVKGYPLFWTIAGTAAVAQRPVSPRLRRSDSTFRSDVDQKPPSGARAVPERSKVTNFLRAAFRLFQKLQRHSSLTGDEANQESALSMEPFWPEAPRRTQYRIVDVPPNTFEVRVATNARVMSFCSQNAVYLYDVQALLEERSKWRPTLDVSPRSASQTFEIVKSPKGRIWKSVLIAGQYIALLSYTRNSVEPDKLKVYEYTASPRRKATDLQYVEAYNAEVDRDCFDIQLSSKGHLAMSFKNWLLLRHKGGSVVRRCIQSAASIRRTTFSDDGHTLCVWSVDQAQQKHAWHFLSFSDYEIDIYKHFIYAPMSTNGTEETFVTGNDSQDVLLVPIQKKTAFLARDMGGQVFYLDLNGEEMLQQNNDSCDGVYMALSCAGGSVAFLQRADEKSSEQVSMAVLLVNAGQDQVRVQPQWAQLEIPMHGNCCGSATFSEGSRIGIISAYPDGTLMKLA